MDVISRLEKEKLVPVIKLDTPDQALPNVIACGGSWMVKGEYIKEGQFDKFTELSAAAKVRLK